jgi:hypothetical protein
LHQGTHRGDVILHGQVRVYLRDYAREDLLRQRLKRNLYLTSGSDHKQRLLYREFCLAHGGTRCFDFILSGAIERCL